MTIKINTGSIHVPPTPQVYPSAGATAFKKEEFTDTTPSEMVVFPSEQRRLIVVEPNTMIILTGYNLDDQTKVAFRKVLRSNGVPAHGSNGCCPTITVGNATRLHSVDVPCWAITHCNPIFILQTPGNYELDVIGSSADVVVTARAFPIQPVNEFGTCKCTTG